MLKPVLSRAEGRLLLRQGFGDTPKPYGVAGWDSAKPGPKGYLIYQNCCAILVLCTSPRVVSRFSVLCGGWDTLEQNGIIWSIRVPPAR